MHSKFLYLIKIYSFICHFIRKIIRMTFLIIWLYTFLFLGRY